MESRNRLDNDSPDLEVNQNEHEPDVISHDVSGPVHFEKAATTTNASPSKADSSELDDDAVCTICFESYTIGGAHRMACLKCGHLFGRSCIEQWFQQTAVNAGNRGRGFCPTCKQEASLVDIRDHYCQDMKVIDNSKRDEAIKERDKEREEKKKLQIELATVRQQRDTDVRRLRDELHQLQQRLSSGRSGSSQSSSSVTTNVDRLRATSHQRSTTTSRRPYRVQLYQPPPGAHRGYGQNYPPHGYQYAIGDPPPAFQYGQFPTVVQQPMQAHWQPQPVQWEQTYGSYANQPAYAQYQQTPRLDQDAYPPQQYDYDCGYPLQQIPVDGAPLQQPMYPQHQKYGPPPSYQRPVWYEGPPASYGQFPTEPYRAPPLTVSNSRQPMSQEAGYGAPPVGQPEEMKMLMGPPQMFPPSTIGVHQIQQEPDVIYNDVSGPVHQEETVGTTNAAPSKADSSGLDDDAVCAICFDAYTTTGAHRMTCLKCGHLFGRRCIEKWFQQTLGNAGNRGRGFCPTCKQKARLLDIRDHYCRGMKVIDNSERDEAIKERDREREEKKKLQIELATVRQQRDTDVRRLQDELHQLQQRLSSGRSGSSQPTSSANVDRPQSTSHQRSTTTSRKPNWVQLQPMEKLEICKDGEARVMDYSSQLSTLVASSKTTAHLFPGHGLTKVQTELLRVTKFVRVHSQSIRDVKYAPSDALILTASLDKCLRITSSHNDNQVHSWNGKESLWSCCWKTGNANYVFAGTHNGKVKLYDSRMPVLSNSQDEHSGPVSTPVDTFDCGNKGVLGLHWVDAVSNSNVSGLLVSMIDRLLFLEHVSPREFRPHVLATENKITSACYDKKTQHLLVSFGPSAARSKVEHALQEISYRNVSSDPTRIEPLYSCNSVRSFYGGQQQLYMCRNTLFPNPESVDDSLMALVFDELTDKLQLWDASSGQRLVDAPKSFGNFDKMLYLADYDFRNIPVVAALGYKSLYFYRMVME